MRKRQPVRRTGWARLAPVRGLREFVQVVGVKNVMQRELAVEVYGLDGRGKTQAPIVPWLMGTFCGTGTRQGPYWKPSMGEGPRGYRIPAREADNLARVVVVWTKRGR